MGGKHISGGGRVDARKGAPQPAAPVDATDLRIGLVAARFNLAVVERLVTGAVDALVEHGADRHGLRVLWVPGAFEVPVVLERMAASGAYDLLIALGCVVRGATPHFDYVAGEAARGAGEVARKHGLPVGFGVLTVDTWEQAEERAGGLLGNKGAEAALSAVETLHVLRGL